MGFRLGLASGSFLWGSLCGAICRPRVPARLFLSARRPEALQRSSSPTPAVAHRHGGHSALPPPGPAEPSPFGPRPWPLAVRYLHLARCTIQEQDEHDANQDPRCTKHPPNAGCPKSWGSEGRLLDVFLCMGRQRRWILPTFQPSNPLIPTRPLFAQFKEP